MKGFIGLIKQATPASAGGDIPDTFFFSTAFADQGVDASSMVPWEARANEVGARRLAAGRGSKLLQELWSRDNFMARLGRDALQRLEKFLDFASLPANRDVIRQDEHGNFMLVLLSGSIAVDREQPWGERLHLTEARPGDILGEMSLLDSGPRFSVCTSLTDCEIAILGAQALDEMMATDPALAASLIALLARKLSRRMRVVSARLSEQQS
ncbi:cyclic nucleotide-binding domain-containing protein [Polaromonas sp. CG_9.11]|uniref:cyclic nucleotide-binding domain-containing protein n=1 Tax=Polaromonas sp. CG_9.11 TaxID=2787730 RepID=UPI0018CA9552|nr:cyclic nucleotide-binding domain-containing protein [Polaromonas sp. CG_9.11]MBG6076910.1 CRP-like cAMP-binding protein [Polaromonas sp. CG_9.11]